MTTKIDSHPMCKKIVKRLAGGEENSTILHDYPGLTRFDLNYYRDNRLEEVLSKSPELKAEIEGDLGNDTLAEVRDLKVKAVKILDQAERAGDLKTALLGIREARGCLDSILKAEGRIQEQNINVNLQQVNIYQSPEWSKVGDMLLEVLGPYPELKPLVARRLLDLARDGGA